MPQGLQVFDASGNIIVDTSTALGTVLGTHSFVGAALNTSDSISVSGFALGTPFFSMYQSGAGLAPTVTTSGTTLSWIFDQGGVSSGVTFTVIFGVA